MSSPSPDDPGGRSFATIDLARRNLRFANFQGARLQGANLTGAHLQGANLINVRLQGAHLGGAHLQGANLSIAHLQGANLMNAHLQGAYLSVAHLQGANLRGAQLQGTDLEEARLQSAGLEGAQLQGANLMNAHLQCANLKRARLQGTDLEGAQLQGSSGNPDSGYLVWAPGVSHNFPADKSSREEYLETLVTDETATVKLAWGPGMSLEEHLRKCMEKDQGRGDRLSYNRVQPDWNAWAEWTAEFACEDQYTARSSLKRWRSDGLALSGLKGSDRAEAQKLVREALAAARETGEKCPGLHSISDDEWKEFIGS